MTIPTKINDILPQLHKIDACNLAAGSPECIRFYIACMSLIQHRLPLVAATALKKATDYLNGQVELNEVTIALVDCWKELDTKYKSSALDAPDVSAIRAVICILYAEKNPQDLDVFDQLVNFLEFSNNVELHIQDHQRLLQEHFSHCL